MSQNSSSPQAAASSPEKNDLLAILPPEHLSLVMGRPSHPSLKRIELPTKFQFPSSKWDDSPPFSPDPFSLSPEPEDYKPQAKPSRPPFTPPRQHSPLYDVDETAQFPPISWATPKRGERLGPTTFDLSLRMSQESPSRKGSSQVHAPNAPKRRAQPPAPTRQPNIVSKQEPIQFTLGGQVLSKELNSDGNGYTADTPTRSQPYHGKRNQIRQSGHFNPKVFDFGASLKNTETENNTLEDDFGDDFDDDFEEITLKKQRTH